MGKKKNNEIDCTGETFLSKCHINKVINLDVNDNIFLKELRKIKLDEDESILRGSRFGVNKTLTHHYNNIISLKEVKKKINYKEAYLDNKKKYIKNNNINNKIKYKYYKYKHLINK